VPRLINLDPIAPLSLRMAGMCLYEGLATCYEGKSQGEPCSSFVFDPLLIDDHEAYDAG
jgi:hypothetical protein